MAEHCILGYEQCYNDSCITCGWNKIVANRRITAIRVGGLQKDEETGLYGLKIVQKENHDGRNGDQEAGPGVGRAEEEQS